MPNPKLEALLRSIIACVGRKTTDPLIQWNEETATFTIQVNARDQGRFIGKAGIVIWALKSIFWYAGLAQIMKTVDINLLEPKDPSSDQRAAPFKPNASWNRSKFTTMLERLLQTCFNEQAPDWHLETSEPAKALVTIEINKYLRTPCSDPDLEEAIRTLVHAAGMADGCAIKTEASWT